MRLMRVRNIELVFIPWENESTILVFEERNNSRKSN